MEHNQALVYNPSSETQPLSIREIADSQINVIMENGGSTTFLHPRELKSLARASDGIFANYVTIPLVSDHKYLKNSILVVCGKYKKDTKKSTLEAISFEYTLYNNGSVFDMCDVSFYGNVPVDGLNESVLLDICYRAAKDAFGKLITKTESEEMYKKNLADKLEKMQAKTYIQKVGLPVVARNAIFYTEDNFEQAVNFMEGKTLSEQSMQAVRNFAKTYGLKVTTAEGIKTLEYGTWIIATSDPEVFSCKTPEEFAEEYKLLEDEVVAPEHLPPHMCRVFFEKYELDKKITDLGVYLEKGAPRATEIEAALLKEQLGHMVEYSGVLKTRLALYPEPKTLEVHAIFATDLTGAIGLDNNLLWHIPEDLKHFKDITMGSPVIMGRKTFESMGSRALPKRFNVVVTSTPEKFASTYPGLVFVKTLQEAYKACTDLKMYRVFIIGGASLYKEAFNDLSYIHRSIVLYNAAIKNGLQDRISDIVYMPAEYLCGPVDENAYDDFPFKTIFSKTIVSGDEGAIAITYMRK